MTLATFDTEAFDSRADRAVEMTLPVEVPPPGAVRSLTHVVARLLADGSSAGLQDALHEIDQRLPGVLHDAFNNADSRALLDIHQTLYAIYELSFGHPLAPGTAHEHSEWVVRIRNEVEREWLASDLAVIETELPQSADLEREEVVIDWFHEQASHHRELDTKVETYLAEQASLDEFKRFVLIDAHLNYRFYDAITLAQLHYSETVKQELSHHFWDECGEGDVAQSHTRQFTRMLQMLDLQLPRVPVWKDWRPYAGYNLYLCFGLSRRHYFKAIGSLAMPELFDPDRDRAVVAGLSRVTRRPQQEFGYYYSHIEGDEEHGPGWLDYVIRPMIQQQPGVARELAIGAATRMEYMRRFNDYLADEFGLLER